MSLTKTTLYLPDTDYRRMKALARQQDRPTAELLREAITEYVQRHGAKPLPRSLGIGHSGRSDLSERTDELLEGMAEDG